MCTAVPAKKGPQKKFEFRRPGDMGLPLRPYLSYVVPSGPAHTVGSIGSGPDQLFRFFFFFFF